MASPLQARVVLARWNSGFNSFDRLISNMARCHLDLAKHETYLLDERLRLSIHNMNE